MLRSYGLALGFTAAVSGIIKQLVMYRGSTLKHYLAALFVSLLLTMFAAVILAVLWERAWHAPVFVCFAATTHALLFYRPELAAGYGDLAAKIVMAVAVTVWVLATIGCYLRRRLRAMD